MLRILVAVIIMFLLLRPAYAGAGFFEEKDAPKQETDCSKCKSKPSDLNPNLKEKVTAIEKTISNNLNKKENSRGDEIILFIDLLNSSSDRAVKALAKFKKDSPGWKIRGVIVADKKNLKEKLLQKRDFFAQDIEFSTDLSGNLAKEFGVFKTPAYVITHNAKQQIFTWPLDLDETISNLTK